MVGDEQRPGHHGAKIGLQVDPERVEQGSRPALLEQQAAPVTAPRENEQCDNPAAREQQDEAEYAVGAGRQAGFVQSACPR
jgi:hypothetical protein